MAANALLERSDMPLVEHAFIEHIQVRKNLNSEYHGMCNACGPNVVVMNGAPNKPQEVVNVRMPGIWFSLCKACAGRLKDAL